VVARAISASRIPVVSAVGHETDFTISDFVADVRVPTPTAAPTVILADYVEARTRLGLLVRNAGRAVKAMMDRHKRFIESLGTRYGLRSMSDRLAARTKFLDDAVARMGRALSGRVREEERRARDALSRIERSVATRLEAAAAGLAGLEGRLEALSPLSTLKRGYSVVLDEKTGRVVSSYAQLKIGDDVLLVLSVGGALCKVENTQEVNDYERDVLRRGDEENRGNRRRARER